MPYLFLLFIIAYIDRVNVGYAKLQMAGALGFSDEVYGLGAAEAGFFPGIIIYLSHWFRASDRAKAVAMFMAAVPLSNVLGSPVSGLLLEIDWHGIEGWRWLFIIEGIPAIVFGVITAFYLTDRPQKAKWLPDDERDWIVATLEEEARQKEAVRRVSAWQAFKQREVVVLTATYFLIVSGVYGVVFWLPTLVKRVSGASNLQVTLLSALPYLVGLATLLVIGWSSDRTGERRWHTAGSMIAASIGLLLSALLADNIVLALAALCIAAGGLHGYLPSFWALATSFLTGTAAAVSVGLINSVGNLGGFVGPYLVGYLTETTGSFFAGIIYLSASALAAAGLVLSLRHLVHKPGS